MPVITDESFLPTRTMIVDTRRHVLTWRRETGRMARMCHLPSPVT